MLARPLRTLVAFSLVLLVFLTFNLFKSSLYSKVYVLPSGFEARSIQARQIKFWQTFLPILHKNGPDCPSPERSGSVPATGFNAEEPPPRPSLVSMPEANVLKMQQAHTAFLQQTKSSPDLKPVFIPNSRGAVYTAGGKYLPVFVISLRMLRRTGSNLPVELFLKDHDEYESSVCDEVIPSLNGRCIVLSDILGSAVPDSNDSNKHQASRNSNGNKNTKVEIGHYQLKIFAMLFSSFEEIVWIDADCFPLHKPEELLDSPPFKLTGMVTWPDFWISSVSPLYYNISKQPIPPMGLRASSETGQILLSKKTHPTTLLLSTYYNYYGPSHYFALLSQGAPGEGDKETFLQAASAAGEPFYATSAPVAAIGHLKANGTLIAGSAMVQFDPAGEYGNRQISLTNKNKNNESNSKGDHGRSSRRPVKPINPPRVSFIHANFPKFNPATVFDETFETKPTYRPDGSDGRAWVVARDTIARFGYDVERTFWEEILWVACEQGGKFKSWEGKQGICERVRKYWGNVFGVEGKDEDGVLGLWGAGSKAGASM
ncbi:uncharacterized protein PADG_04351 [Paracoccidioides brasiliensis Pb18]|uniref:Alpha-1,2-mannosyltransferase n=1 Tax=Paracoccidioides brasiliensis (strain Pb18) TaxID=502780 RepID=C1GAR5_PARBD|nr:uncharacterized protein PADG_04351 [Paracoccidioides brasiliensis Pb18]EEH48267.1 hypothetical protein PADG_04351 [Paracoccidioides brasiliensis Pb18]ODH52370.1 hypothetical protein GX48_01433 [Paracoccidioides brasiliensis]